MDGITIVFAIGVAGYFIVCGVEAWRKGDEIDGLLQRLDDIGDTLEQQEDEIQRLEAELTATRARITRKEVGIE